MRHVKISRFLGALLVGLLAAGLLACGSDDGESGGSATGGHAERAKKVEKAFLAGMVHHHESAVDMADLAKQKGESRFVKELGTAIKTTQEKEIAAMKGIHERLLGSELKPDPMAHDGLGLSAEEAGMTHDAQTNHALSAARPFDRAFVDEMVPHHEGAVKMARVVREHSKDRELRSLAQTIITTQQEEIEQMNSFRTKRFGGPVPEGAGHGGHKPKKHDAPAGGEEHGGGHSG